MAVLNVYYDVKLDFKRLRTFFAQFNSSRLNMYTMMSYDDYKNDLETNDIFLLPCFGAGPIRANFYQMIADKLKIEWFTLYRGIFLFITINQQHNKTLFLKRFVEYYKPRSINDQLYE
jgi:hypothetical protein